MGDADLAGKKEKRGALDFPADLGKGPAALLAKIAKEPFMPYKVRELLLEGVWDALDNSKRPPNKPDGIGPAPHCAQGRRGPATVNTRGWDRNASPTTKQ